jgi:monovalent cation:H+ antiporter-2, CPA2 family
VDIPIEQILQDFAIVMIISTAMAVIFHKLKQPLVIGFIVAGIIIGPYSPPFSLVKNQDILNLFAELGVILLLFTVGMEFPIQKLRNIGKRAMIIATTEAFGTLIAGFFASQALGLSFFDSLFLSLSVSVTSTVIVMRVLEELKMMKDEAATLILGTAIIEDILVISLLAIFQSVGSTGNVSFWEISLSIGMTLAFIGGVLLLGSKTIPKLIDIVAKTNQHDVLIVACVGLAFGMAFLAFELGISVAAGAFFAGVLIAESKSHAIASVLSTPVKDIFAALFFVSVGALMDFKLIPLFIIPAIVLIIVSIVAKFATVFVSARLQKIDKIISLRSAIGLSSSGGELALVIAKGGSNVGVTSSLVLPMVGTMTIITTFIAPYIIKYGWKFVEKLKDKSKKPNKIKDNNKRERR